MNNILKLRFEGNMHRHLNVSFNDVLKLLTPEKLSLIEIMEKTNGEPDCYVINGKLAYIDSVKEIDNSRMNLCYDEQALKARKKFPPKNSVEGIIGSTKLSLLTEEEYFIIQAIEDYDLKTSSWLKTPSEIRERGGAIFGSKKYGRTFIYHNGADAYYSTRGYRTIVYL